jgi:predicted small secreted protein
MKTLSSTVVAMALLLARANTVLRTGEDLRANASDIMLISVISVESKTESDVDPCVTVFAVSGRVIDVNTSSIDAIEGDRVAFSSFGVDTESVGCLGYAGPLPPPTLEAGWCGRVYLKQNEDGGLSLAAYGYSLVPTPDEMVCPERPVQANEVDVVSFDSTKQIYIDYGDEDSPESRSGSRTSSSIGAKVALISLYLFL